MHHHWTNIFRTMSHEKEAAIHNLNFIKKNSIRTDSEKDSRNYAEFTHPIKVFHFVGKSNQKF